MLRPGEVDRANRVHDQRDIIKGRSDRLESVPFFAVQQLDSRFPECRSHSSPPAAPAQHQDGRISRLNRVRQQLGRDFLFLFRRRIGAEPFVNRARRDQARRILQTVLSVPALLFPGQTAQDRTAPAKGLSFRPSAFRVSTSLAAFLAEEAPEPEPPI